MCSSIETALIKALLRLMGALTAQVRQSKLQAIFVCITPPSREELERRLRDRGTETEAQVQTRLKTAETELARCAAWWPDDLLECLGLDVSAQLVHAGNNANSSCDA